MEHKSLFLYPLWSLLGKSRVITSARYLPKTIAVLVGVFLLAAAMVLIQVPHTLHCNGVLLPKTRQKIYALESGKIHSIEVEHGQLVTKHDKLAVIENEDIQLQVEQTNGQIAALEKRLESNRAIRLNSRGDRENRQGQVESDKALEKELDNLKYIKSILSRKSQKLTLTSPIAGEVITWNVRDRLMGKPVQAGELLMEVADINDQWEIELQLPDHRIGHLLDELTRQKQLGNLEGVKVTYQLAAAPGATFEGRIVEVAKRTQVEDNQQSIRVKVEVNEADIEKIRQANTTVSAKIFCENKSLGYVWFHDVADFVKTNILFRLR